MIVGRRAERERIENLLDNARNGRGGALVVDGEPGIGKSTMLDYAAAHAIESDPTDRMELLRCAGVESEVEQAFSGLHQLLHPVLDRLPRLPAATVETVRRALGYADGTVIGRATDLTVSAAVLDLLVGLAGRRPLLAIADDAHWLDRSTVRVLQFAARRLEEVPIAVLFAVRRGDPARFGPAGLPGLTLEGLPDADGRELLATTGWRLARAEADAVVAATGGNPLALMELADRDDPARVLRGLALTGLVPVNERLRAGYTEQIGRLPTETSEALLVAAADETSHTGTVRRVLDHLDLPVNALEPAERAGLIAVDSPEVRFRHPLIRSAAYATATFERRRRVHRAIAHVLAAESQTARAAWHRAMVATGTDRKLADELARSADTARGRGGEAAAAAVLQRAADLSETDADRRERLVAAAFAALDAGRPDHASELADRAMGAVVDPATGRNPAPDQIGPTEGSVAAEVSARLVGTIELYDGDPGVARTHLLRSGDLLAGTDPEEAAWMYALATSAAFHAGDLLGTVEDSGRIADLACSPATQRAGACLTYGGLDADQLWDLAESLSVAQPRAGARPWMWATTIGWLGPNERQALRFAEHTARRVHAIGATAQLTELMFYTADLEYRLGHWDDGVAHTEEGLRCALEAGQRNWRADLLALRARFAAARGDATDCRRYADQATELATPIRERLAVALASAALGLSALAAGDPARACTHLEEVLAADSPRQHLFVLTDAATEIVESATRAGRDDLADSVLSLLLAWGGIDDRDGDPAAMTNVGAVVIAAVHHGRAMCLGDRHGAEEHFLLALAVDELADRPFQYGRIALHYGEWLRRRRRPTDARRWIGTAVETFQRLGATPWSERAGAELRAAGGNPPPNEGATGKLSAQELAVVRLAASGLNNRQIAERMVLSPRTIGSHLYRAFPKLGISRRAQLRDLDLDNPDLDNPG